MIVLNIQIIKLIFRKMILFEGTIISDININL